MADEVAEEGPDEVAGRKRRASGAKPAAKPGPKSDRPSSYRELGRMGGEAVREKYGHGFYAEIGKKGAEAGAQRGGEARKAQLGQEGYAAIGRKGGEAVRAARGSAFYAEIGRKGGEARRAQLRGETEE